MIWLLALYVAIPVLGIMLSGRQYTWQGWIYFILLWPIAWLWDKPEELP